jgi:hypothetical protein
VPVTDAEIACSRRGLASCSTSGWEIVVDHVEPHAPARASQARRLGQVLAQSVPGRRPPATLHGVVFDIFVWEPTRQGCENPA